jgi:hypothetical protein
VLCLAVLTTGAANMLLSLTGSLPMFYLLFCVARTNFAGLFDLGIYGAVNNWFVARRAFATAIAALAQMAGLVSLPLIAQATILRSGWRAGWLAVGIAVLAIGFIPSLLYMVRQPKDLGLVPDRDTAGHAGTGGLLTLLPIACADYYGRVSYGAIGGIALSVQVLAHAAAHCCPASCAIGRAVTHCRCGACFPVIARSEATRGSSPGAGAAISIAVQNGTEIASLRSQ